ncbi:hypothetical protein HS088_TW09G01390 [Tripterygium wilfordii]|uniref:C2 NT-type domain-containing protein n=1 Tax=Tripterygium wilfordii TaxID=458696 RepID=A0A7J7DAF3_TRIWF|nr:uncharacterized protein LOC120006510 [Tripterygium wilfordii]KAF5743323.1 hypothetical protein HS088_TW09G01390 [Tripterygium wilfordii]
MMMKKKQLHVKVKPLKLEGFFNKVDDGRERKVKLEMKWRGPNSNGLVSFYRNSTCRRNYSTERLVKKDEPIEWDDEFESVCNFWVSSSKDNCLLGSWAVSFHVLYSTSLDSTKSSAKYAMLGKASFDLANLASTIGSRVERKLPVTLCRDGIVREANLLVSVSFAEVITSNESAGVALNLTESNRDGFFRMMKNLTSQRKNKKKENEGQEDQITTYESDQSRLSDSDGSPTGNSLSLETQLDLVQSKGLLPWKRRRLGFRPTMKQCEPVDNWEMREIVSRDGKAKLKANVFFASFDQRSEKAAGESACTAVVAVIADRLLSNPDSMPARSELDSLITQGSSEWQRLCSNETYMNSFPDKHFDLETVLEAELMPTTVLPDKSFTGFFSPEKFESLKEAMSFDEIWNKISNTDNDYDEPKIYIVSWNDHFFVLKVDIDAYYVIDSLGERLYEGCNRAYILRFDDSSLLHGKVKKPSTEYEAAEATEKTKDEEECEEIICRGKECCREFVKQFLAAISLGELEEEEKKGTISNFSLIQRLQIDFHYCSSSLTFSSSSSAESSTYSLFSGDDCI